MPMAWTAPSNKQSSFCRSLSSAWGLGPYIGNYVSSIMHPRLLRPHTFLSHTIQPHAILPICFMSPYYIPERAGEYYTPPQIFTSPNVSSPMKRECFQTFVPWIYFLTKNNQKNFGEPKKNLLYMVSNTSGSSSSFCSAGCWTGGLRESGWVLVSICNSAVSIYNSMVRFTWIHNLDEHPRLQDEPLYDSSLSLHDSRAVVGKVTVTPLQSYITSYFS
jgi:hypothetical protein